MNYTELSLSELNECCYNWAKTLKAQYDFDLIIYIAKAGYIIGKAMGDVMDIPIVGINASRKGNRIKGLISPIFSKFPNFIRNAFITVELKSNIHAKDQERQVAFHKSIENIQPEKIHSILIVDDSVDTGYSLKEVQNKVHERFTNSCIYTAALNVWDKSESVVETNFSLFNNTVIKTPMSKDSMEYNKFIELYKIGTKNEYI